MSIEVGVFRPGDAAACEAISAEVFEPVDNIPYILQERYGIPGYGGRMNAFYARGLFESSPGSFLVAREEDEVVGYAGLSTQVDLGVGWLVHIGVKRTAQNRGIGHQLVLSGLRHFRALGLPVAWIAFDNGNERAGHLYRKLGFRHFATEVYYVRCLWDSDEGPALAVKQEPSVEALLRRLPPDKALFAEEELAVLYGLPAGRVDVRRACLRERLGPGSAAYVPAEGDDVSSFAIAEREVDGPVLRLAMVSVGEPATTARLLRGVLARYRALSEPGLPRLRAVYIDRHKPDDESVLALKAAGFQRVHHLLCLSRRL